MSSNENAPVNAIEGDSPDLLLSQKVYQKTLLLPAIPKKQAMCVHSVPDKYQDFDGAEFKCVNWERTEFVNGVIDCGDQDSITTNVSDYLKIPKDGIANLVDGDILQLRQKVSDEELRSLLNGLPSLGRAFVLGKAFEHSEEEDVE
jgi:hypothetical protein